MNTEEASGASQIYVKALDKDGNPQENAAFVVARPGAEDPVVAKGPIDGFWGNYTMYGLLGTYTARMTEGGHPSERVSGVGLGSEEVPNGWTNTAFRFTFQLVEGSEDIAEGETTTEDTTPPPPDEGEAKVEPTEPTGPDSASLRQDLIEAAQAHLSARSPRDGSIDMLASTIWARAAQAISPLSIQVSVHSSALRKRDRLCASWCMGPSGTL